MFASCQVRVWHIVANSCLNILRLDASIISLAFHPCGEYIAVASGACIEVWRWNKATDRCFHSVKHMRNIRAVIFHPVGDYLLVAAPDSPKQQHETSTHCRYEHDAVSCIIIRINLAMVCVFLGYLL